MPLLIALGILAVNGVVAAINRRNKADDIGGEATHNMMVEMTGKSKKECKKILKNYTGGWLQK